MTHLNFIKLQVEDVAALTDWLVEAVIDAYSCSPLPFQVTELDI